MGRYDIVARPLSELYQIILDEFVGNSEDKYKKVYAGICYVINYTFENNLMSNPERYILKNHLISQSPSEKLHPEFFHHPNFTGGIFWWGKALDSYETGDEAMFMMASRSQRIKFLEKMIEITKTT